MRKVQVNIEMGSDGTYNAYMPNCGMPFGAIGEGATISETKKDFLNVVADYEPEYGTEIDQVTFFFHYDMASFLSYLAKTFTLAGLSRITGVAAGQLSHYLNGYRKPSAKTVAKIQAAMRRFGEELSQTTLM